MAAISRQRLQSIDVYRGVALLAMATYHAFWDLTYYDVIDTGIGVDLPWIWSQRLILSSFLLLSGAGLVLAHEGGIEWGGFWKREALLVGAALLVTAGTYFLLGAYFSYFGVLHAIALFSLLGLPFIFAPLWVTGLTAAVFLLLPAILQSDIFDDRPLAWIGFFRTTPETADLVPLFPWFGVVLLGIGATRLLRQSRVLTWRTAAWPVRALGGLGRWSLLFYLVHQPLLVGIVMPLASTMHQQETAKLDTFSRTCQADCMAGKGKAEGAGALQFCTAYCHCLLDETVRNDLWTAPSAETKQSQALCTAMAE